MEQITDWKGNVIKEGYEICFITIIKRDYDHSWGMYLPHGDGTGTFKQGKLKPDPDEPCWIVWEPKTVVNENDVLGYYTEGFEWYESEDGTVKWKDALIFRLLREDKITQKMNADTRILAIKGISDNEEEYRNFTQNKKH